MLGNGWGSGGSRLTPCSNTIVPKETFTYRNSTPGLIASRPVVLYASGAPLTHRQFERSMPGLPQGDTYEGYRVERKLMFYVLQSNYDHSVVLTPTGDSSNPVHTQLEVDLGSCSLFAKNGGDNGLDQVPATLNPLQAKSAAAFATLSQVSEQAKARSPIVKALFEFQDAKLPELLQEASLSAPESSINQALLDNLEAHPQLAQQILSKVVRAIDRDLPGYLSCEKRLGTYDWLVSGTAVPLDFKVVSTSQWEALKDFEKNRGVMTDVTAERQYFQIFSRTAITERGTFPAAHLILNNLCTAGTLGEEVLEINRASLLDRMFGQVSVNRNETLHMAKEAIDQSLKGFYRSGYTRSLLFGGAALSQGAIIWSHVMADAVSGWDIGRTAFAVLCAAAAIREFMGLREMKATVNGLHADSLARVKQIEDQQFGRGILCQRLFPTALIEHITSMSAGRQRSILGEKSMASWLSLIPRVAVPDQHVIAEASDSSPDDTSDSESGLTIKVSEFDDFSNLILTKDELEHFGAVSFTHALHIERAAQTWNAAHAMEMLREFCEMQNISSPDAPWFDHFEMIEASANDRTDERGSYPSISKALSALTSHFGIDNNTWKQISLALHAACTLMRMSQTRQALQIAGRIVHEELA